MKRVLLIMENDPFSNLGGAQTAYQNLIQNAHHLKIHILLPKEQKVKAPNVHYLSYTPSKINMKAFKKLKKKPPMLIDSYLFCESVCKSIAGQHFDIIEIPDFENRFVFLLPFFKKYNISYGKLVLALHGSILHSSIYHWDLNNALNINVVRSLEKKENLINNMVDIRYSISDYYIDLLQKRQEAFSSVKLPIHKISCFSFLTIPNPHELPIFDPSVEPVYSFVGRMEKRKGLDIFLNIVNLFDTIDPEKVVLIGEDIKNPGTKKWASSYFNRQMKHRNLSLHSPRQYPYQQLREVYKNKAQIGAVTTRFDSFNLVALEFLLYGHPIIIGKNSGVYHYIKEAFAGLRAFESFDLDNYFKCVEDLEYFKKNYHTIRQELIEFLKKNYPFFIKQRQEVSLLSIYELPSFHNIDEVREEIFNEYLEVKAFFEENRIIQSPWLKKTSDLLKTKKLYKLLKQAMQKNVYDKVKLICKGQKLDYMMKMIKKKPLSFYHYAYIKYPFLKNAMMDLLQSPQTPYHLSSIEKLVYALRQWRMTGWEQNSRKESVLAFEETFKKFGCNEELSIIKTIFSQPDTQVRINEYLHKRYQDLKKKPRYVLEERSFISREKSQYKVSIIVSLYNVDLDELNFFLNHVSKYSMLKSQEAEIVFIDSGSKKSLIPYLQKCPQLKGLSYLVIRTKDRETIQRAWNRGILKSIGQYLVFLGVDEGLKFNALNKLSNYLDLNPQVNWVMSNTIMETLNSGRDFIGDVMTFNRNPLTSANILFDCTYLLYVGGMYRRTLHEHGYYDCGFSGAGDTEFKCRLFPHIKSGFINEQLGFNYNFEKPRTTESPHIEVEDFRAWYLFRTYGGVKYLLSHFTKENLETMLIEMMGTRRSFCTGLESDVFFSAELLKLLCEKFPEDGFKNGLELFTKLTSSLKEFASNPQSFHKVSKRSLDAFTTCGKFLSSKYKGHIFSENLERDAFFFAHGWLLPFTESKPEECEQTIRLPQSPCEVFTLGVQ